MVFYLEKMMERLNSGESKIIFRNILCILNIGLMKLKSTMARGRHKKRYQYCTDSSGEILYLRALQGHSRRKLVDPWSQDNVINPERFHRVHLSRWICNQFTFHQQFRIDTGKSKFQQTTDNILLPVDPMNKEHKDPETIDLKAPATCTIHAYSLEERSKHCVLGRYQTCSKERIKIPSGRDRTPSFLYNTLPAYCIPKVVRIETGERIHEKVYESPRPHPKISLRHDWMKELGSEVARQAEGSQPTQPNRNPIKRTGRPVVIGQPTGSSTPFDEGDIDFRVSGLPHAVVKQAENSRVCEHVKNIENHRYRQALQDDLQQK